MSQNTLKQEFEYYLANQDELVEKYTGKYIVITGQEVVAEYDDELTAVQESQEHYEAGTFPRAAGHAWLRVTHSDISFSRSIFLSKKKWAC